MDPKSDQNGTTNHKQNKFLRFLGVLEETVFSRFLETKTIGPKSRKIRKKISEGALVLVKSLGPAECAVPAER
jgi:hypothetical protein